MHSPSAAAMISGVNQELVRNWRMRGLIDGVGTSKNSRYSYSEADIVTLAVMKHLAECEVPLADASVVAKAVAPILLKWRGYPDGDEQFLLLTDNGDMVRATGGKQLDAALSEIGSVMVLVIDVFSLSAKLDGVVQNVLCMRH